MSRKVSKVRYILPWIFLQFTRHPRQIFPLDEIQWSQHSWVHNIFRFYELLFGRKEGIRPEISSFFDKNKMKYVQVAHTFEGQCALLETWIRNLRSIRLQVNVYEPGLAMAGGMITALKNYKLNIAFDAADDSFVSGTSLTWSHTCTGSNLMLWVGYHINSTGTPTDGGATYNSVSMTITDSQSIGSNELMALRFLVNPSTGINSVVISSGGSASSIYGIASSYSGCKQSGQPDAHTFNSGIGAAAEVDLTVVSNQCWVIAYWDINNLSVTFNMTSRDTTTSGRTRAIVDSNGVVATGTYKAEASWSGSINWYGNVASFVSFGNTYTISFTAGSYSLTGEAVNLLKAMTLSLTKGVYALTGSAITFIYGHGISIVSGIYSLSGQAVTLTKAMGFSLSKGVYTLTGNSVTLARAVLMSLMSGVYTLTGYLLSFQGWIKRIVPTTSWSKRTPPSTTFTKRTPPSTIWTKRDVP